MPAAEHETWSPNWANTWVADVPGVEKHIGRCLLVASRARRVIAVGDSAAALHRAYEKATVPSRRVMVEAVKLTTDDELGKVYRYLAPNTKVVYYALCETTNVIKIGTSKDVTGRLLQIGDEWHGPWRLLAVEPGSYQIETRRHEEFSAYWIPPSQRGEGRELFQAGPRLVSSIQSLVTYGLSGFQRREDVTGRSARLVLDAQLPEFTYRPRLNTLVDLDVLRRVHAIAVDRGQSLDDVVEAALLAQLPSLEATVKPPPPPAPPTYGKGLIGPPIPTKGYHLTKHLVARAKAEKAWGQAAPERPAVHDEPEPVREPQRQSVEWVREQPEPGEHEAPVEREESVELPEPEPAPRDDITEQLARARDVLDQSARDAREHELAAPEPAPLTREDAER